MYQSVVLHYSVLPRPFSRRRPALTATSFAAPDMYLVAVVVSVSRNPLKKDISDGEDGGGGGRKSGGDGGRKGEKAVRTVAVDWCISVTEPWVVWRSSKSVKAREREMTGDIDGGGDDDVFYVLESQKSTEDEMFKALTVLPIKSMCGYKIGADTWREFYGQLRLIKRSKLLGYSGSYCDLGNRSLTGLGVNVITLKWSIPLVQLMRDMLNDWSASSKAILRAEIGSLTFRPFILQQKQFL
ncbi:mitochondrial import inner membrane translocase [Striga asiatica]|uniref:Mitochondrial import inner membrane translocase n=1 Tax=Striga asiatica TaxID=4170 RepID=A0A5A7REI5_STRAF|nr:mitochondrial import inner membrane translocase [Striga asiatica]